MSIPGDALDIYRECFELCGGDDELILGFAAKHGKIHIKYENGTAVNMICEAEMGDSGFCYIFACATPKGFRKKGIFRRHTDEVIGNRPAILIPESEELFAVYTRLGFVPIYHLETESEGSCEELPDFEGDIAEMYGIYKSSCACPEKGYELFAASVKAFFAYGGKAKLADGVPMLVRNGVATEIFAPDAERALSAAKACKRACLPLRFSEKLDEHGIKYEKKCIAMAKNIPPEAVQKIYINNLFN